MVSDSRVNVWARGRDWSRPVRPGRALILLLVCATGVAAEHVDGWLDRGAIRLLPVCPLYPDSKLLHNQDHSAHLQLFGAVGRRWWAYRGLSHNLRGLDLVIHRLCQGDHAPYHSLHAESFKTAGRRRFELSKKEATRRCTTYHPNELLHLLLCFLIKASAYLSEKSRKS